MRMHRFSFNWRAGARSAVVFASLALITTALLPASRAHADPVVTVRDDAVSATIGGTTSFAAPGLLANDDPLPPGQHIHALSTLGYIYAHFGSINDDGSYSIVVGPLAGPGTTYDLPYCFGPSSAEGSECTSTRASVRVTAVGPTVRDDAVSATIGDTTSFAAPGLLANDDPLPPSLHIHALSTIGYDYAHFGSINDDGSYSIVVGPLAGPGTTYDLPYCFGPSSAEGSACASNRGTVRVTAVGPTVRDDTYNVVAGTTRHIPAPGVRANDDPLPPNLHVHALSTLTSFYGYAYLTNVADDGSVDIVVPPTTTVGGRYDLAYCFGASADEGSSCASNEATIWVNVIPAVAPPAITSASSTTFTAGAPGAFTVTATGTPAPTLSLAGAPPWLTLAPTGPGTATLSGTPPGGSAAAGPFHFTIRAHSDDAPPDAEQTFTLNVVKASTTTSAAADPATFGAPLTLRAAVATAVAGETLTPTGNVTFQLDGVTVGTRAIDASGHASLTLPAGITPGPHTVTATYGGDINFAGSSGSATASLACAVTISGDQASLVFSSGAVCLEGAHVRGSVTVTGSASVAVIGSTVSASIVDNTGGSLQVCGSSVGGNVVAQNATGFVLIGDPAGHHCDANDIAGSIVAVRNTHGLVIVGNHYGQDLIVSGNSGAGPLPGDTAPKVSGNTKV